MVVAYPSSSTSVSFGQTAVVSGQIKGAGGADRRRRGPELPGSLLSRWGRRRSQREQPPRSQQPGRCSQRPPPIRCGLKRGRRTAASTSNDDCAFCRIASGAEPGHVVFEDNDSIAFLEQTPLPRPQPRQSRARTTRRSGTFRRAARMIFLGNARLLSRATS